ncbi:MAG TPA: transposase [Gemmataceae bacterium]|jgi:putative DNA methylase
MPTKTIPLESTAPRGWHSRGYLPHFDGGSIPQTVVFRLADSLPAPVVESWRGQLRSLSKSKLARELRRRVEEHLDAGHGECHLRMPCIGAIVQNTLLFFDGTRYRLHAWVVMPNHVHALFTPCAAFSLSTILHSWKSFTSKEANTVLGRQGQFWEEDYFDRFIRDDDHFVSAKVYIENNPVKAGLCSRPEDWLLSSASYDDKAGGTSQADETSALRGAGGTPALQGNSSEAGVGFHRSAGVPPASDGLRVEKDSTGYGD